MPPKNPRLGRKRRYLRRTAVVLLLGSALIAVLHLGWLGHYPVNDPITEIRKDRGYRAEEFEIRGSTNELLLLLTLSGGGTRASAFAYGVLEELARTEIDIGGRSHRLLDEVDLISAVSGGSITAAYYGLFGDRIFEDFEAKFLKANVQRQLLRELWKPVNWPRLASFRFGRSDLAAEHFDRILFEGMTFSDLKETPGPAIILNSSDIGMSVRFDFLQDSFDVFCSDMSNFPISRAVAASSAVPIVMSAITLRNYSGNCGYRLPDWAREALEQRDTTSRRYHQAARLQSYLERDKRPFIHLMDGGLTDNLGVRPIMDKVFYAGGAWEAVQAAGGENVRKIAIIVVNAQRAPDIEINLDESSPGIYDTLKTAGRVPLDQYTFESLDLLDEELERWAQEIADKRCERVRSGNLTAGDQVHSIPGDRCDEVSFYLVEIDFDRLPDPDERDYLKSLPTNFGLSAKDVDRLKQVGAQLLSASPAFKRLVRDLNENPLTPNARTRTDELLQGSR